MHPLLPGAHPHETLAELVGLFAHVTESGGAAPWQAEGTLRNDARTPWYLRYRFGRATLQTDPETKPPVILASTIPDAALYYLDDLCGDLSDHEAAVIFLHLLHQLPLTLEIPMLVHATRTPPGGWIGHSERLDDPTMEPLRDLLTF